MKFEVVRVNSLIFDSDTEKRLFTLMRKTVSTNISLSAFRKLTQRSREIKVIFCIEAQQDIGFMYCGIFDLSDKLIIIRPMLGMLAEYRKDSLKHAKFLLAKAIFKEKIKHLRKRVCMVTINLNPLAYAGLCVYWRQTYPSSNTPIPRHYLSILNQCSEYFQFNMTTDCVVKIPFQMLLEDNDIQRMNPSNPYIGFFFSRIQSNDWDEGLLTVTPVNVANLLSLFFRRIKKMTC